VPVGAGQGRPGPVGAGAGAGAASASSAGADRCRPVPTGADRCRPVPVPLTDRKKRCIFNFLLISFFKFLANFNEFLKFELKLISKFD